MNESTQSKTCTTCGVEKSIDSFHADRRSKDGHKWACKFCTIEVAKKNYLVRKLRPKSPPDPGGKPCTQCKVHKAPSDFYPHVASRDGLTAACAECLRGLRREWSRCNVEKIREYRKAYDEIHRDKKLERLKSWREANPERRREYQRQYDAENADRVAAWKRAWYDENKAYLTDRLRSDPALRQRQRANMARYRERNRDVVTERQRKRRVDRLGLTVESVDLDALWTGHCGICARPLDAELRWPDPFSKSIDHIIPLAHGGTHQAHNLQWAHLRCNISKGASMPE